VRETIRLFKYRRYEMNRIATAIRLTLALPPVWIALAVSTVALTLSHWNTFLDIAAYAAQRLFQ
jgi:hypothetical protein